MDDAAVWLIAAGAILVSLLTLKHRKFAGRFDPFGQYLRSGGKMLRDYDEDQKFIDKYSK